MEVTCLLQHPRASSSHPTDTVQTRPLHFRPEAVLLQILSPNAGLVMITTISPLLITSEEALKPGRHGRGKSEKSRIHGWVWIRVIPPAHPCPMWNNTHHILTTWLSQFIFMCRCLDNVFINQVCDHLPLKICW
jgi:hypothetical protein